MSLSSPKGTWEVDLPAKYNELTTLQRSEARRQYSKLQHHMCFCCGKSLYQDAPEEIKDLPIDWSLFPSGFTRYPIHLQHNHQTGMTEGAIHSFCNAFLWMYFRR